MPQRSSRRCARSTPDAGIRFETICEMPASSARADDPAVLLAQRLAASERDDAGRLRHRGRPVPARRHPDRGVRPRPHRAGAPGRRVRVAGAARRLRALPARADRRRGLSCRPPLKENPACQAHLPARSAGVESIRTLALVGPAAAGKTSLAEALLVAGGRDRRAGQRRARHHGQRLRPARAAHAAFAQRRRVLHLDARRHARPPDRHARALPISSASALPALEAVETAAVVDQRGDRHRADGACA